MKDNFEELARECVSSVSRDGYHIEYGHCAAGAMIKAVAELLRRETEKARAAAAWPEADARRRALVAPGIRFEWISGGFYSCENTKKAFDAFWAFRQSKPRPTYGQAEA